MSLFKPSRLLCLLVFVSAIPGLGQEMPEVQSPERADFSDDQWEGLTYEDLGITQEEFQKVKEGGMSKTKLFTLLEYGVSPKEYFSEPWKRLGVSENHWLREKRSGMEDADIDRSYRKESTSNFIPFISFFLPGFYQYRTDRFWYGFSLSTVAVASGALAAVHRHPTTDSIQPIYPILMVGSMFWSAADAFVDTRYIDNQDAHRFSFDWGLGPGGGASAMLALRF